MEGKEPNSSEAREKVLEALSASPLHNLSRDEILLVLKEDGVDSLEGLVGRLVEPISKSESGGSVSPDQVTVESLSKPAPRRRASTIVHRVPKVPFILDGVEYDPEDIRRFVGRELHYVIGSQFASQHAMLAFEDRDLLVTWLQIIYLSRAAGLNLAPAPAPESSGVGVLVHGPPHESHSVSPVTYPANPSYPSYDRTSGPLPAYSEDATAEVLMFDEINFGGERLTLERGKQFPVLTWITRRQRYNWNDAIMSILSTKSVCVYYEKVHYDGLIRIVVPNLDIFDIDWLGFAGVVSSVRNLG